MLVVLAIITILAAIVLTSQSSFNRTLILDSTAYDIGLTVRSAETYGIGSRTVAAVNNVGFGVDFEASTPTVFTLFGDTSPPVTSLLQPQLCHPIPVNTGNNGIEAPNAQPGDCQYEAGSDVTVSTFAVGNGVRVSGLEALVSTGGVATWQKGLAKLDIVFSRPNAEPFITANSGGALLCSANNAMNATGGCSLSGSIEEACIVLASPSGGTRAIKVNMAGEITANTATCL